MILGGFLLTCLGWAITFGLSWGNFWIKIGISVTAVCLYSLLWQRPKITFQLSSVGWGVFSAGLLYGIFLIGNLLAPYIISGAQPGVDRIYVLGEGNNQFFVFLLLFFITGPGEEIFWRGFMQDNLMKRLGPFPGFALTTLIYGGVHIFSLNLMLILAAFVAGAFWGGFFLFKRNLLLLIISHSLWSSIIFAVAPVR